LQGRLLEGLPDDTWKIMRKAIQERIKRFVLGPPRKNSENYHNKKYVVTPQIVDECLSELQVEKLAKENAKHNLPQTASSSPGSKELEIEQFFQTFANASFNEAKKTHDAFCMHIQEIDVEPNLQKIKKVTEKYEQNLGLKIREASDSLKLLLRNRQDLNRDLNDFRSTHLITRVAKNTESRLYLVGILLLILVLEVMMNGYFFALGDSRGYIGGVFQAALFAGINIVVSFSLGKLVTFVNHDQRPQTIAGLLCGLTLIFFILTFNLAVAHYRDVIMSLQENYSLIERILSNGIYFENANSTFLWVMGIAFGCIAAADGYHWDDPFPGYGSASRRAIMATEDFFIYKEEVTDKIQEMKTRITNELHSIRAETQANVSLLKDTIGRKESLLESFHRGMETIENGCETVIAKYRETNIKHREDSSPPEYFSVRYSWPLEMHIQDSIETDARKLLTQEAMSKKVIGSVDNNEIAITEKTTESFSTIDLIALGD
jgi:hypothetical protein